MVNNFIFDIDGTLIDSRKLTIKAVNYALNKVGHPPLTADDIRRFYLIGFGAFLQSSGLFLPQIFLVVFFFRRYKFLHLINLRPFPTIVNTLNILQQKQKTLGVVSSNPLKTIKQTLVNTKLKYFSFTYSAGLLGKVHALKKVIKKHRLNLDETVYVGDEIHDIEAASKLGIKSAAVTWGFNSQELLSKFHPDYIINYPKDLLTIRW